MSRVCRSRVLSFIHPDTHTILALALIAGLSSTLVNRATAESFYKGKQVRVVIASGAGGGYDAYGRAVARHIGHHLPGEPSTIAQNMDGAGGLVAMNYTYNKAEKDGTVMLATYNSLTLQPLFDARGTHYDPRQFNWIGSVSSQQNICVTWHTSPVHTLDQAGEREVIVASTGASSDSSTTPKILNALAGTKFKVILGYGTSESRLAVERGEVDGVCGLSWSTLKASNPDWLDGKKLNILTQMGLHKHPDMPDVPLVTEFVKDPGDQQVLTLLLMRSGMGRPFVAPPGVPADRLTLLRDAFMATMKDHAFIADATKMKLEVDPMGPEEMAKLIKSAYDSPQSIVESAGKLIAY
jgi:tripartite-type tricarboxylate transporter receptor subunit TctC